MFSNLHSLILVSHNASGSVLVNLSVLSLAMYVNKTSWSTQAKRCVLYIVMEASQAICGKPICFTSFKSVHHIL